MNCAYTQLRMERVCVTAQAEPRPPQSNGKAVDTLQLHGLRLSNLPASEQQRITLDRFDPVKQQQRFAENNRRQQVGSLSIEFRCGFNGGCAVFTVQICVVFLSRRHPLPGPNQAGRGL